nr:hypothetical protein [Hyalangium versicolor]
MKSAILLGIATDISVPRTVRFLSVATGGPREMRSAMMAIATIMIPVSIPVRRIPAEMVT